MNNIQKMGVRISRNNKGIVIPVGSNEYDWEGVSPFNSNILLSTIRNKISKNEPVGFCLFLGEEDFILIGDGQTGSLNLRLTEGAPNIAPYSITNFNHYLELFVPTMFEIFGEVKIECSQYIDRITCSDTDVI